VNCSLPSVDIEVDVDVNAELKTLSTDSEIDHMHCLSSPNFASTSTSTFVREPEPSHVSGHPILNDMFLSRRVRGVRASIFQCSQDHLRKLCTLHGLDIKPSSNSRDMKVGPLCHVLNGYCFDSEKLSTSPDRSACLCVAAGFSSSFSITAFIVDLLQKSSPTVLPTDHLLLIVESLGTCAPYRVKMRFRRQLLVTLHDFLRLSQQRNLRLNMTAASEPYENLFTGFEQMRRPALESVMHHHGLIVDRQNKLPREKMRSTIVSHIASGHCMRRTVYLGTRTSQSYATLLRNQEDTGLEKTCDDFVRGTPLNNGKELENEVKILQKVLACVSSRKTLLRFLECKGIPHDPTKSIRHFRSCLQKYVRVVEKSAAGTSTVSSTSPSEWPSIVPQTLKDKIA
jgi:hypothetical protein